MKPPRLKQGPARKRIWSRSSKMATTWTSAFGRACGWLLDRIVHGLALTRISPNALTVIGLAINIVAAFLFGHANAANAGRMFFYAGCVIFGAGLFDMVDGRVARRNNQVTVFGSFFDSVIDRYSDVVLFFGLLVYYGRINKFRYVVLVAFVMVTSLMVSYTRARAEALGVECKVGIATRPVRVVILSIGLVFARGASLGHFDLLVVAVYVLAILSTFTVFQRVIHVHGELSRMSA